MRNYKYIALISEYFVLVGLKCLRVVVVLLVDAVRT